MSTVNGNLRNSGERYWNEHFGNSSRYSSPEQLSLEILTVSEKTIKYCEKDKALSNLSREEVEKIESVKKTAATWRDAAQNYISNH